MASPFSFLLTEDGDIDPRFVFTPDLITYVAQRLRENISFFLGEWFLDTRQGLPYFQRILGQKYDASLIDQIFRKAAEKTAGVSRVNSFVSSFNRQTRTLSVPTFSVTLKDGTTLTQDDLTQPYLIQLA